VDNPAQMLKAKELNPTAQQYGVLRTILRVSFQSVKAHACGSKVFDLYNHFVKYLMIT
jgi:hypothetical protein